MPKVSLVLQDWDESLFQELRSAGGSIYSNYAVGYNNVDVKSATKLGIPVGNTPGEFRPLLPPPARMARAIAPEAVLWLSMYTDLTSLHMCRIWVSGTMCEWRCGITGVLTETTAELALSLTFAAARRVVEADRFMRRGLYLGWAPTLMVGQLLQVHSPHLIWYLHYDHSYRKRCQRESLVCFLTMKLAEAHGIA